MASLGKTCGSARVQRLAQLFLNIVGLTSPSQMLGCALSIRNMDSLLRWLDFFTIGFTNERIRDIRMSPQIEPLLLDDALKVVLDLQDQWRQQGWHLTSRRNNYAFEDAPEWRTQFRDINKGGTAFWQAEDKYQVMLLLHRFKDNKRPNEERYMITLALSRPWVPSDED